MIFSKLFGQKNKWQHKDNNVRIEAVQNELNPSNSDEASILANLAFSDNNELVRRSALIKLNQLSHWFTAFENENSNSIKTQASDNIIKLVASNENQVSKEERLHFINDKLTVPMCESVLALTQDDEIAIAAIKKINKPHKWPSIFAQSNNLAVQQYLVSQIDDITTLDKLVKKSPSDEASKVLQNKLNTLALEKEKPVKLLKEINLVLAKLLALKDVHDYQEVLEKRTSLNGEWDWLVQDIAYLDAITQREITEKRHHIDSQLDKVFAQIKEDYEQARIIKSLEKEKHSTIKNFDERLIKYNKLLAEAVFENDDLDVEELSKEIEEQTVYVNSSMLNDKEKTNYIGKFDKIITKLGKLPELAENVTKATHLISKMSQMVPPENLEQLAERNDIYQSWLQEWNSVESTVSGFIPQSIQEAKSQIIAQWQAALTPLHKEQKQLFFLAQKKASEVKRLIDSGKFNASFGVFKRFKKLFEQLNQSQKQRLQRDFDLLSEKISELSDWEHYIATPRKQELLEQIKQLSSNPLDNPNEQANTVKECRKIWNSLGHADEEVDKKLNDDFNTHCELAFAPCRLFYAEQEKLREQHLNVRQRIVDDAVQLEAKSSSLDVKEIDTQLNRLTQRWREAGEVERTVYQKLNQAFITASKPLKSRVQKDHQHNATLKQSLIDQVIKEQQNEDIFAAVESVKKLQNQWKSVGFAGSQLENRLWSTFRKANDVVFARREHEKSKAKDEIESRIATLEAQMTAFEAQFGETSTKAELIELKNNLLDFLSEQLKQKPVIRKITTRVDSLIEKTDKSIEQKQKEYEGNQWASLFAIVELFSSCSISIEELENNEQFIALPSSKQKKLVDALTKPAALDQLTKTVELEVLGGIDSPADEQDLRRQIQVKLMQEKMTSGQETNLEKLFFDWLASEPLTNKTKDLLARIKPIYIH